MRFRRPKLHAVTWIVVALLGVALLAANIFGQSATTWKIAPDPQFDTNVRGPARIELLSMRDQFEQGWPLTFSRRDQYDSGNVTTNPWQILQGIERLNVLALVADVGIGLAILTLGGAFTESWRRRRAKVYQLHLVDLFIFSGAVAAGLGIYAHNRSQHQSEVVVINEIMELDKKAIEVKRARAKKMPRDRKSRASWERTTWRWMDISNDKSPHSVFDRVARLSVGTSASLNEVAKLRNIRALDFDRMRLTSSELLTTLDQLPVTPPGDTSIARRAIGELVVFAGSRQIAEFAVAVSRPHDP